MRKVFFGLLAAFLALGACAAIPSSAEGWYTPKTFKHTQSSGIVYYFNDEGYTDWADIDVDENGNVTGTFEMDIDSPAYPAYMALVNALKAETIAQQNKERIEKIGDNLDSVFRRDGISMEMSRQGPDGNSRPVTYTMRIKPGSSGGAATIEAEDPTPYGRVVDDKSIAWTSESANGQLMVKGASTAQPGQVPHSDGAGGIIWAWPPTGIEFDDVTVTTNDTGKAHLVGWSDNSQKCDTDLTTMLTSTSEQGALNRVNHAFLARFGTGNDAVFHYVPVGDRLTDGAPVDDKSIVTNTAHGADAQGVASLYGWATAEEAASATDPKVPYSNGSGALQWQDFDEFFYNGIFTTTTEGKVTLRGITSDAENLRVVTVRDGDGSPIIGSDTLVSLVQSPIGQDANTKKLTVAGWDTGLPASSANLATMLQDGTSPDALLARTSSGGIEYVGIGGLPQNAPVDNVSLATNATSNALEIKGFTTASACAENLTEMLTDDDSVNRDNHYILTRYGEGTGAVLHYVSIGDKLDIPRVYMDDESITTNTATGAKEQGMASLYGWAAAEEGASSAEPKIPFSNGSGSLQWDDFASFFNTRIFNTTSDGKINLRGISASSDNIRVVTVSEDGNGEAVINSENLTSMVETPIGVNASTKKLTVSGWSDGQPTSQKALSDYLADGTAAQTLLVRGSSGGVEYMPVGNLPFAGTDNVSLSTNATTKKLELKDFTTASGCSETLTEMMQTDAGSQRDSHYIVTRYGEGSGAVIHYLPIGDALDLAQVDDKSLETNDLNQIAMKGFADAIPESEGDGAVLPYVSAEDDSLQWGGIETFFASSVFKKSPTTGKMLLNGTSEDNKVKVLTVTGADDNQTVETLEPDTASVQVTGAGVLQMYGFDANTSPYVDSGVNFADALTNTATQIYNMSVPVRAPDANVAGGFAVKYIPMGKITGIPSAAVDNITIETNETDPQNPYLQLHGAAGDGIELVADQVYTIGSDGKGKFAALDGDISDEDVVSPSIESYAGSDGGRYFQLYGWNDTSRNSDYPYMLSWTGDAGLKYHRLDGSLGVAAIDSYGESFVALANIDTASVGAIPYADVNGSGLGWLDGVDNRLLLLKSNSAPVTMGIGASLDKLNVSAVPTLNVAGFTDGGNCQTSLNKMLSDESEGANRGKHQFMARYADGGEPTVHWVGIDGLVGGGAGKPDETTITTNVNHGAVTSGQLSIYGFNDAPNDSILRKDENGDLVWGGASAITNRILAGAGINITDNGGGAITISAQAMEDDSGGGSSVCVVTVVTDARYDETSHKFQVKRRTITFTGSMADETGWQDVFEAVSHKSEHEGGAVE